MRGKPYDAVVGALLCIGGILSVSLGALAQEVVPVVKKQEAVQKHPSKASAESVENAEKKQENPVSAEQSAEVDAEDEEVFTPSYGTWGYSLMFSDADLDRIKKVLRAYESKRDGSAQSQVGLTAKQQISNLLQGDGTDAVGTKLTLPSFYLRSIAYNSAKNWTIWLNSTMIASDDKDVMEHIQVVSVAPERVSFVWSVGDEFVGTLKRIQKIDSKKEDAENTSEDVAANRVMQGKSTHYFDAVKKEYHFSLGINQFLSVEYDEVYEGIPEGMKIVSLDDEATAGDKGKANAVNAATKVNDSRANNTAASTSAGEAFMRNPEQSLERMAGEKASPRAQIMKALEGAAPSAATSMEQIEKALPAVTTPATQPVTQP